MPFYWVAYDQILRYNVTSARRLGSRRPTSTASSLSGRIATFGGREESPSITR